MCSILSVVLRTMGGHGSHPARQRPHRHPCHQGTATAALRPAALGRGRPCPGDRLQPPAPGVEVAPVVSYQALCREIAGMSFGELDTVGARSVIRRYSTEWFEAAKRRKAGSPAGFPRRKRALLAVRWYHG